jgi:NADPH:quinone reductase-like Zn-dependent oxidoreductase
MGNPRFSDMLRSVVTPLFSDKQVFFALASESQEDLLALNVLIEAGDLKATIDEVVPMERIAKAHTRVETEQRLGSLVMSRED